MVEQCEQLQKVIEHIAFFLLHPQDIWGVEGFGAVYLQLLVEWKETKLEEILDDDGNLRKQRQESESTPVDNDGCRAVWQSSPQCR